MCVSRRSEGQCESKAAPERKTRCRREKRGKEAETESGHRRRVELWGVGDGWRRVVGGGGEAQREAAGECVLVAEVLGGRGGGGSACVSLLVC